MQTKLDLELAVTRLELREKQQRESQRVSEELEKFKRILGTQGFNLMSSASRTVYALEEAFGPEYFKDNAPFQELKATIKNIKAALNE